MSWNGIFDDGVFSCGFDFQPTAAQLFNAAAVGSPNTSTTPFSYGASWATTGAPGILLDANLTSIIVGFRFFGALPSSNSILFYWFDQTAGAAQVTLRVDATGRLQFYLGAGTGSPLGSPSALGVISSSIWVWIEAKVTISATVGVVECRINGNTTPVISATGLNTKSTANTFVNSVFFASPSGGTVFFDDWYMLDTTGAAPLNTYLGNVRIVTSVPNGAGAHTQFTPTNPTNVNYTNVGNIPANLAEYNADATVNDIDAYAYPAIPNSPTAVLFLNHWYLTQLDTAGVRTIVPGARSGGTDFFDTSNPNTPPGGTWEYFNKPWVQDPNTSAAWTVVNAGNAQLEIKINT